jgi:hypothetical protein
MCSQSWALLRIHDVIQVLTGDISAHCTKSVAPVAPRRCRPGLVQGVLLSLDHTPGGRPQMQNMKHGMAQQPRITAVDQSELLSHMSVTCSMSPSSRERTETFTVASASRPQLAAVKICDCCVRLQVPATPASAASAAAEPVASSKTTPFQVHLILLALILQATCSVQVLHHTLHQTSRYPTAPCVANQLLPHLWPKGSAPRHPPQVTRLPRHQPRIAAPPTPRAPLSKRRYDPHKHRKRLDRTRWMTPPRHLQLRDNAPSSPYPAGSC